MEIEPLHPIQVKRFREMSFVEKMTISQGLLRMARSARREAFRRARPGLDEDAYDRLVAREFAGART